MSLPKYYEQKLRILEIIGETSPGTMIPTERELAERFDTSRTTIRKAIAELVVEGRLARTQGRGTFVADPKKIHVRQMTSFSEDMTGYKTDSIVLGLERIEAGGEMAARLDVPVDSTVTRLRRLRRQDGEPLAIEAAHLPGPFPGLEIELEARGSLYETLREVYGIDISAAEDHVETALAAADDAETLGVDTGHPLLQVHRTAWDQHGRAAEWMRGLYRGDRFRFVARISR
ncbi:GntR family transcriptional regulator [Zhihengliuella salsuginis]|uniref:HTH-type transcriptional repressor DasR n=1 Tax=Zhihengliuella salsuginis TaxID=578222 RepID=A0ABQ3GI62_9MICC|nr:GntR family transcriptional regulator [Zhihengliuella salsuginis]GHD05451.1 HTH-type transcriptional repressor DasR [Zhihengliuella salsuginis]